MLRLDRLWCVRLACLFFLCVVTQEFSAAVAQIVQEETIDDLATLQQRAAQGNATSQDQLGDRYANGTGVEQDYREAFSWYQQAAEQGLASGQNNLGSMYEHGRGTPQDYGLAVKWYRHAAEQGFAQAQLNLGSMYAENRVLPKDDIEGHKWLNLAAAQYMGEKRQQAVKKLEDLAARMTIEQIFEAQKRAREWKPVQSEDQ